MIKSAKLPEQAAVSMHRDSALRPVENDAKTVISMLLNYCYGAHQVLQTKLQPSQNTLLCMLPDSSSYSDDQSSTNHSLPWPKSEIP